MDVVRDFWTFLQDTDFAVPLGEVTFLLVFNSLCLLYGAYRLGLLITYCFVFYWGFFFNQGRFFDIFGGMTWGLPIYLGVGILMFTIIVVRFLLEE